jgi:putative membrane protein
MLGGSLFIGDTRLYDFIFVPLVGEPYYILKFDQIIHAYGFGVTTFVAFHLLKPVLRDEVRGKVGLAIVLAMAGLGAGALNEIVEFTVTVISPSSGIGGYVNNSLDLVFNGLGATAAAVWLYAKGEV